MSEVRGEDKWNERWVEEVSEKEKGRRGDKTGDGEKRDRGKGKVIKGWTASEKANPIKFGG